MQQKETWRQDFLKEYYGLSVYGLMVKNSMV